jgi:predicted DNA binding CopG/RHH family protein
VKFADPYDHMSDEELDRYLAGLRKRTRSIPTSIKLPDEFIQRIRDEATRLGIPYEILLRGILAERMRTQPAGRRHFHEA